jgi:hypothetical protein
MERRENPRKSKKTVAGASPELHRRVVRLPEKTVTVHISGREDFSFI